MKDRFLPAFVLVSILALVFSFPGAPGAGTPRVQKGGLAPGTIAALDAQAASVSTPEWVRGFGRFYDTGPQESESEAISDVQITEDGGFVVVGEASYAGSDYSTKAGEALVMQISPAGDVAWKVFFESDQTKDCDNEARSICRARDGGYLVVGNVSNLYVEGRHPFAMKLSRAGGVQWIKSFGFGSQTLDEYMCAAAETADGGYILVGLVKYDGFWMLKLDPNGNPLWQKWRGSGEAFITLSPRLLQATPDGGFLIAGLVSSGGPEILKLDARGNAQWHKTLAEDLGLGCTEYNTYVNSIFLTPGGGFILAGSTAGVNSGCFPSFGWLCRLDSVGRVLWQTGYSWSSTNFAIPTHDGGYLAAGGDRQLLRIDSRGAIQWQKAYETEIVTARQTDDGGYVLIPEGDLWQFQVLRVDQNGMIGPSCPATSGSSVSTRISRLKSVPTRSLISRRNSIWVRSWSYVPYPRPCEVTTICIGR